MAGYERFTCRWCGVTGKLAMYECETAPHTGVFCCVCHQKHALFGVLWLKRDRPKVGQSSVEVSKGERIMAVNYDEFGDNLSPQTGAKFPKLENLADGDYDFTILTANQKETKNGHDLIELECRCEETNQIVPKTYFVSGDRAQEQIDRFSGDCGTLGFPVGTWGKAVKLSVAIPQCLKQLAGKRFAGTKKTNRSGEKEYHNLYINAALPDAPIEAGTPGHNANDEIAF